jgi:type IV fimbrial biogenesis protein FimT
MRVQCRHTHPSSDPRMRTSSALYRSVSRGFTLVELAITVTVLAVLMGLAAPLFNEMMSGNRLTGNANELVAAVQIARSEAIRGNVRTSLCQSTDGATCSNASPWRGWIVFADANGNNLADGAEVLRAGIIEAPVQVLSSASVTNANTRITFRADGLAYAGNNLLEGNLRVCLPVTRPALNVRDVNIAIGGRIAVRPPINAAGACNAPGNI